MLVYAFIRKKEIIGEVIHPLISTEKRKERESGKRRKEEEKLERLQPKDHSVEVLEEYKKD